MTASDVIQGKARWSVEASDCLAWLGQLPADSVDLCVFSPPYEAARTYSVGFNLRGQEWVDWMVQIFGECQRVCRGLVACVCEGQTRKYRWSATPALLMADLHRAGFHLRRPVIFHRVGIPGSGGPDWFRADTEYVICTARPGRLPWSDNTSCGAKCRYSPGGAMSHRLPSGIRVGDRWMTHCTQGGSDGNGEKVRTVKRGYKVPDLANPGNLISCAVGGSKMGHPLAHENEAPYPLGLPEFFIRSCCPPGGVVLDCFSGSGTTAHAALICGRRFIGCDLRESQVALTMRRLAGVTPALLEV